MHLPIKFQEILNKKFFNHSNKDSVDIKSEVLYAFQQGFRRYWIKSSLCIPARIQKILNQKFFMHCSKDSEDIESKVLYALQQGFRRYWIKSYLCIPARIQKIHIESKALLWFTRTHDFLLVMKSKVRNSQTSFFLHFLIRKSSFEISGTNVKLHHFWGW